ncbi:uncharacterized protein LOC142831494 [Microtus pennsylvanicus]|uniref:uncharacterized protein LOC142831494 n=1 Tax=Microtus pennsylvanicus TaxID=10058 RepID=UPI003F6A651A
MGDGVEDMQGIDGAKLIRMLNVYPATRLNLSMCMVPFLGSCQQLDADKKICWIIYIMDALALCFLWNRCISRCADRPAFSKHPLLKQVQPPDTTEPKTRERTGNGGKGNITQTEGRGRHLEGRATVGFTSWGSALAGSASRAGLSSAPGGGTESLPPPHKLLPLPQPGSQTPPHPTVEAAASSSRVAALCCREAGRRHRKGPGRAPLTPLARSWGHDILKTTQDKSGEAGNHKDHVQTIRIKERKNFVIALHLS